MKIYTDEKSHVFMWMNSFMELFSEMGEFSHSLKKRIYDHTRDMKKKKKKEI